MLRLAWLNINRNRHRTLIIMASVFLAVFFCIMFNSVHQGVWNSSINSLLKMTGGHVEIHGKDFVQSKSIDDIMIVRRDIIDSLARIEHVQGVFPCLESFVLLSNSSGITSKGVFIVGIDPVAEKKRLGLVTKVIAGKSIDEAGRGIFIGMNMSKELQAGVGDSIIVIGRGYHGSSAVGMFPVLGILKTPVARIDKSTIFTTLETAQELFGADNGYSSIYLMADQTYNVDGIKKDIAGILPEDRYSLADWKSTLGDIIEYSNLTKALGLFVKLFLYLIVVSNILGTVIMQTNERKQEFSMMISIGMSRRRLNISFFYELAIIAMSGVAAAFLVSAVILLYFNGHPITLFGNAAEILQKYGICPQINLAINKEIFINQILVMLCICMAVMAYPMSVIKNLSVDICQNKQ